LRLLPNQDLFVASNLTADKPNDASFRFAVGRHVNVAIERVRWTENGTEY